MGLGGMVAMAAVLGGWGWGWTDRLPDIEEIRVVGFTAIEEGVVREMLDLEVGGSFVPNRLEAGIERLLSFYENNGYPFAAVEVDRIALTRRQGVAVDLGIDEGPRVIVDSLRVEGNKTTREEVVLREFRMNPNAVYTRCAESTCCHDSFRRSSPSDHAFLICAMPVFRR